MPPTNTEWILRYLLTAIAAVAIIGAAGAAYFANHQSMPGKPGSSTIASSTAAAASGPESAPAASQVAQTDQPVIGPDEHVLGKADAPVTMIEYGSYTCPHCARFDQETFPKLKTDFIDKGQVRFVFREFVRNGVDIKAAQLVHCGPPDTFFNFVDVLFRSQESWAFVQDPVDALKKIGRTAGLDSAKIDQCLADEAFATKLVADTKSAYEDLKIQATPTLVVNGTSYPNIPYEDYDDNGAKKPGLASAIKGLLPKP